MTATNTQEPLSFSFVNQTYIEISGDAHPFDPVLMRVRVQGAGPEDLLTPNVVCIDPDTRRVRIVFAIPYSGTVVLLPG